MNYLKKHVAMHEVNPIICYQLYTCSKKKKYSILYHVFFFKNNYSSLDYLL